MTYRAPAPASAKALFGIPVETDLHHPREALPVHGAEASRRPGTRRRPPCGPQLGHLLGAALHPPPPAGIGPDMQPERPRTEVVEVNPAVLCFGNGTQDATERGIVSSVSIGDPARPVTERWRFTTGAMRSAGDHRGAE